MFATSLGWARMRSGIRLRGKQILRSERDFEEGLSAVRIKFSAQKNDRFLSLGLTEAAHEEEGPEGAEHVRDLIPIGENGDVSDEHFPEVCIQARRQNKR